MSESFVWECEKVLLDEDEVTAGVKDAHFALIVSPGLTSREHSFALKVELRKEIHAYAQPAAFPARCECTNTLVTPIWRSVY
jgi:hypothetical protein